MPAEISGTVTERMWDSWKATERPGAAWTVMAEDGEKAQSVSPARVRGRLVVLGSPAQTPAPGAPCFCPHDPLST